MGFRYRKSVKILPGMRLNLNKNSHSVTLGSGRIKHTFSSTGRHTRSVNLPGNFSHVETVGSNKTQRTNKEVAQPSPKIYKVAGCFSCICAVALFLMSLLLLIVEPACGIIFAVFAVLIFIFGRKYIKRSKAEQ
jgi:hypothetical protein